MTRETILRALKSILAEINESENAVCYLTSDDNEVIESAIKALEQEPCEDCISRQAVLDGIDRYIEKAQSTGAKDDFISFAELVVKELPSVNPQEPNIKALGEELRSVRHSIKGDQTLVGYNLALGICNKYLSDSGEQEPKTGHWNDIPKYINVAWYCSECEYFTTMKHKYCPNCGAKMESEETK